MSEESEGRKFLIRYALGSLAFGAAIMGLLKACSLVTGIEVD